MKRLLVILDGMDDEPSAALRGLTPRQAAAMPALDAMGRRGAITRVGTIPPGNAPATDVALLCILGQTVPPRFSGRAWLEALGAGISTGPADLCLRCNLVSLKYGRLVSHTAGNISDADAADAVARLNRVIAPECGMRLYHGCGYRNILVMENCPAAVCAEPPHELLGSEAARLRVTSDDALTEARLNRLIALSRKILAGSMADGIALWAPSRPQPLRQFPHKGAVVTGTHLVRGIARALAMDIVEPAGATGGIDTDYAAKLRAAVGALDDHDFVLLHIEAPDEASHALDPGLKKVVLEAIDRLVIAPLLHLRGNVAITVQADHAASSVTGRHLDIPVESVTFLT